MQVPSSLKANVAATAGAAKKAPAQPKAPAQDQTPGDTFQPSEGFEYSGSRNLAIMGGAIVGSFATQSSNPYIQAAGYAIGAVTAASGALQVSKGADTRVKINGALQALSGVATIAAGPMGAGIVGPLTVSAASLALGHAVNQPGGTITGIAQEYGGMMSELGGSAWDGAKSGVGKIFSGSKEA